MHDYMYTPSFSADICKLVGLFTVLLSIHYTAGLIIRFLYLLHCTLIIQSCCNVTNGKW